MFFLTSPQANDMLVRTGFLSEGESLLSHGWGAPNAQFDFQDHYRPQAVARALADSLRDGTFVLAAITSTGMHPEHEDMNLYYGYRRSLQDHRSLLEAPAHLFEVEDYYHLRSMVFMWAAFRWDVTFVSSEEAGPIELSREESLRFHYPQSALAKKFEAALTQKKTDMRWH